MPGVKFEANQSRVTLVSINLHTFTQTSEEKHL